MYRRFLTQSTIQAFTTVLFYLWLPEFSRIAHLSKLKWNKLCEGLIHLTVYKLNNFLQKTVMMVKKFVTVYMYRSRSKGIPPPPPGWTTFISLFFVKLTLLKLSWKNNHGNIMLKFSFPKWTENVHAKCVHVLLKINNGKKNQSVVHLI